MEGVFRSGIFAGGGKGDGWILESMVEGLDDIKYGVFGFESWKGVEVRN